MAGMQINVFSVPLKELLALPGSGGHEEMIDEIGTNCYWADEVDEMLEDAESSLSFTDVVRQIINGKPLDSAPGFACGYAFEAICWALGSTLCHVQNHFEHTYTELEDYLQHRGFPLSFRDLVESGPILDIPLPDDWPTIGWWTPEQIIRALDFFDRHPPESAEANYAEDMSKLWEWFREARDQEGDCIVGFLIDGVLGILPEAEGGLTHLGPVGESFPRKSRLFACACARCYWPDLTTVDQYIIEASEQFTAGLVDRQALNTIRQQGTATYEVGTSRAAMLAHLASYTAFPFAGAAAHAASQALNAMQQDADMNHGQQGIYADLFGPQSLTIPPSWLQANHGAVMKLARTIYHNRTFHEMPVLGDALEEAGCDNEEMLAHCRQPGEHIRGCWLLDLILGLE